MTLRSEQHGKSMPRWMLADEDYVPATDKDSFVNRSILGLMEVLSLVRSQSSRAADRFSASAPVKVLGTLLLVVLTAMTRSEIFLITVITYLLLQLSVMRAGEISSVLKLSFGAAAFTAILLLPAVFLIEGYSPVRICAKLFATVMAVNLLSRTTRWDHIAGALKYVRIPDLFIFVLDSTIKYILLLGEFSLEQLQALKLRSVGKNRSKYTALSGVAGTLFLRSVEMAEEMHSAMECRGFTGEYRVIQTVRFGTADILHLTIHIGLLVFFIFLSRG